MSGKTLSDNKGVIPLETYLVHANYIQGHDNKVKLFKTHNLWFERKIKVSVCTCVRSRGGDTDTADTDLVKHLLKSIDNTVSVAERVRYDIRVYVYYDDDDVFWRSVKPSDIKSDFPITFNMVPHTDRIPWNEVTKHAYDDGTDYIFRTNDDVELKSTEWISLAIRTLVDMSNVGVVGPKTLKGNTKILTLDFTHRTHIDIFGTYYPPEFKNWYVDDFITYIYNDRLAVLRQWVTIHLVNPTRYSVFKPSRRVYAKYMHEGKELINDYLNSHMIPVVVGSKHRLPCATKKDRSTFVDFWVVCTGDDDPCGAITEHILPTLENDFLTKNYTYRSCTITPGNRYRVVSVDRHILTQTVY
jgi:hypothetical protein